MIIVINAPHSETNEYSSKLWLCRLQRGITSWTAGNSEQWKSRGRLLGPDSWLATADYYLSDRWLARAHRRAVTLDRLRLPISGKNSQVLWCRPRRVTAHWISSCQIWNLKPLFKNENCVYWWVNWFHLTPLFGPTLTHQTSPLVFHYSALLKRFSDSLTSIFPTGFSNCLILRNKPLTF